MDKKHQIEMIRNKLSEENIQLEYNIKKECQKQYEEQETNHKLEKKELNRKIKYLEEQ